MQKARGQSVTSRSSRRYLPQLVSTRFQVLFHSPPGVLFTFPSRYSFAIGHKIVFSLTRWSGQIHTGFLVSRATWESQTGSLHPFAYWTVAVSGQCFHTVRLKCRFVTPRPDCIRIPPRSHYTGGTTHAGFNVPTGLGCFPFARRY